MSKKIFLQHLRNPLKREDVFKQVAQADMYAYINYYDYRRSQSRKSRDKYQQMEATHKLLRYGKESKKNLEIAKQLKDENLDDDCTFEPHFYTSPSSRANAKPVKKR